jgi:class 3 adenylate cyclase
MEPRIQYAQTKDGVSIAFWTLGEGMPLIDLWPTPFSHIQFQWQVPEIRRWYERLAEKKMLVAYDSRGAGLSDRDVTDMSLDAQLLDLEAVVDRLALRRFALLAINVGGPAAIAYAARHPERVSHLSLWCCSARGSDFLGSPRIQALFSLVDSDWELFTETFSHILGEWPEREQAQRYAAFMRESVTPKAMRAAQRAMEANDATGLLAHVKSPTLVLHRQGLAVPSLDSARNLAARIADAHLAFLEGTSMHPLEGDTEALASAIDDFLTEGEEAEARAEPTQASAFRTVLFTDVEGSTALTQRLGDARARALLRQHERIVREALKAHGGSEVKTTGDGFMTSFSSATKALESAIAMQRAFAEHNESAAEPILVRVGLNAGEPIAEDEDLYGTAVNLAARIAGKAKGGEILASDVVRQLVAGKDFLFSDRGEVRLRGFDEPVRLYEVRWGA